MPRPPKHRDALVAETAKLLRRQGYSATGLDQILVQAGATNGSLYHHFPGGKEELALAALGASAEAIRRGIESTFAAHDEPTEALRAWITFRISELEADPLAGCPIAPAALDSALSSPALRAASDEAFASWESVLTKHLRRGGVAKPDATARVVLSAIEGALLLDRTAGSTTHLRALRGALPLLVQSA
jgi:TetR/AcrR family transcriptional repressor of lmrAB and yxaGH operons